MGSHMSKCPVPGCLPVLTPLTDGFPDNSFGTCLVAPVLSPGQDPRSVFAYHVRDCLSWSSGQVPRRCVGSLFSASVPHKSPGQLVARVFTFAEILTCPPPRGFHFSASLVPCAFFGARAWTAVNALATWNIPDGISRTCLSVPAPCPGQSRPLGAGVMAL